MNISEINSGVQVNVLVGTIVYFARTSAPVGWLECNGASLNINDYNYLYSVIGTRYGSVDSNSFNLPDFRGEFIRCWSSYTGEDNTRSIDGNVQMDTYENHMHWMSGAPIDDRNFSGSGYTNYQTYGLVSDASSYLIVDHNSGAGRYSRIDPDHSSRGGVDETRPRNIALLACIKY